MEEKLIKVEQVGIIKPPVATAAQTPEQFAKGRRTATMIFDKPVTLTIQHGEKVHYPAGVHEVPVEHKDHWYLKAHNVREYAKPVAIPEKVPARGNRQNAAR